MSEQENNKASAGSDHSLINASVSFANQEALMKDVVKEMIDKRISSVLVEDEKGNIVGIITERDIVHKFTLLELDDKLTRTVATVMTRPVEFVQVKDVHQQIMKLHLEKRVRHFPVLSAKEPKRENLVGIVSITDIARNYMLAEQNKSKNAKSSEATKSAASLGKSKPTVGIIASQRVLLNAYIEIFNGLGFAPQEVSDINKFASGPESEHQTLILDLDGFSDARVHEFLPLAVKAKFHLVLTTSKPALLPIFKRYISRDRQEIAMKPLDISYLSWLLQTKWQAH